VSDLEDHDLLYAAKELLGAFDFLHAKGLPVFEWPEAEAPPRADELEQLGRMIEFLSAAGQDLLYVNLSSPDLATLGLHTVRVLIPGLQPIDFGWNERRLGGERLFELPHRLGFTVAPTTPDVLNPFPHPLA